ncbi:restriction endonuclease subunit S [Crocinitomicaceae bacterium]|nr:restriction endonuclease subunit S [Crocinitomicaceae bacterium]
MSTTLTHIETQKQLIPALRFKEFEEEWNKRKLSDVCAKIQDGNYGGSYPKSEEFVEEGIPFLTSKALGGNGILKEDKVDFLTLEKHQELKKAHLKLNDVLFTNRGSNVGSIGFTDERIAHGNIGPQLTLLRSNLKIITPHFLYQIMTSNIIKKQVSSQDSGSAMNFFGIGATSKFKFSIPSLPEQEKIASFLSAVDEKIQQFTKKKALLEQYKKGVMQQLFSGQVRFKDKNGNLYPDWEEKRFGLEISEYKGKSKVNDEYEVLTSSNKGLMLQSEYYGENRLTGRDNLGFNIVPENHITFRSRSDNRKFTFNLNNLGLTGVISTYYPVFKSSNGSSFFIIEMLNYNQNFIGKYSVGTSQTVLSMSELKRIKFKFPCSEEQQKIASYLSRIDTKIEAVNNQTTQTQTFKKGLLQQMFV